jgi:hypothetical protein
VIARGLTQADYYLDECSRLSISQVQFPTEFLDPLSHAGETDANRGRAASVVCFNCSASAWSRAATS